MSDRMYRYFERPLLMFAVILFLIYYPMAVLDGSTLQGALVGGVFWIAQGVCIWIFWKMIRSRAERRHTAAQERRAHRAAASSL